MKSKLINIWRLVIISLAVPAVSSVLNAADAMPNGPAAAGPRVKSEAIYRDVMKSDPDNLGQQAPVGRSPYLAQLDGDTTYARERWNRMTQEEKQKYRSLLRRWKDLTPEQQRKIRENYQRFKNLPPEKRNRVKKNWKRYQQLSPDERRQLRQKYQKWQNLSPSQKQRLRKKLRRYREMTPEQKQRLQQKRRRWQNLTPEQKRQLREQHRNRGNSRLRDIPKRGNSHRRGARS
jgi:hypothetical protein